MGGCEAVGLGIIPISDTLLSMFGTCTLWYLGDEPVMLLNFIRYDVERCTWTFDIAFDKATFASVN